MSDISSAASTYVPPAFKADIGKDTDWSILPIETMIRRQVMIKHVWILSQEEVSWISNIFLKKATAADIVNILNENHEYQDRLEYIRKLWDIHFIDMAMSTVDDCLKSKSPEEFLLSFRENSDMNFRCVIIKRVRGAIRDYVKLI